MKTKDLVDLVRQGVTPIIRFRDPNGKGEYEPDPGMIGRIKEVSPIEEAGNGESLVWFTIDFFEFTEKNTPLAQRAFYDNYGNPTKTWMEFQLYEESAKNCDIFEMYEKDSEYQDLEHIEILPENTPFVEYVNSGSKMSYTAWLEYKLMNR